VRRALERADEDLAGGEEQEEDRVREERERCDPSERETPPAGRDVRSVSGTASDEIGYAPIFAGQSFWISAFAADCWPFDANLIFA